MLISIQRTKIIYLLVSCPRLLAALLFLLSIQTISAQELPLENFVGLPQFNNAKLSPDGKHLALTSQQVGTDLLAIFETENYSIVSTTNTSMLTGIQDFWWVSNEDIIYTTQRQYGWLDFPTGTGDLYVLNVSGSKEFIIIGPGAGNFGQYSLLDAHRADDEIITIQARERGGVTAYPANINRQYGTASTTGAGRTGTPRLRNGIESPLPFGEFLADHNGEIRLAYQISPDGTAQLQIWQDETWSALPSITVPARESLLGDADRILGFNRDNNGVYFIKTSEYGTSGLALYDLNTNQESMLFTHEKYDIGASNIVWSSDKQEAIGIKFFGAGPESHYFSNHPEVALQQQLDGLFPGQQVLLYDFSEDGTKALAKVTSDTSATSLFILDRSQGQFRFFSGTHSDLPAELMAPVQAVALTARDGLELEGFLTQPLNSQGPHPLIVLPHSGPHGVRDSGNFSPEVQLLANRGFAVLQVNFRGSGGYGESFFELGLGNWGTDMVDDIADSVNWAVREGYADPGKICIYGHDYGAYASMMAAARYPDLFQCAVGYAGIYDLTILEDNTTPFSPWGTGFLQQALGTDQQVLSANSPVNLADNIKVPVFLAHGKFDARASEEQFNSMIAALALAGVDTSSLFYEREGHGFSAIENRTEFYSQLIEFFQKHLN